MKYLPSENDKDGRQLVKHPSNDIPVNKFFDTVDTSNLMLYLSESDKYESFAAALASSEYSHMSYSAIMRKFNITLHELNVLYRDGQRNMGLFAQSNHLPKIMEDVAVDAESKEVTCSRCDGEGVIPGTDGEDKTCPECRGVKTQRKIGDKHARDLIYESMGLTAQKGPLVAIQNNQFAGVGSGGLNSSMEDMLRTTQTITMGDRSGERE
jgi:hypothetical protein